MVYNYKKQRSPIVPMYTILGSTDGVLEKNVGDPRAAKQQIRKIEDTPAPNSYSLPNMVGRTTQIYVRQRPWYFWWGRPEGGSFLEDLSKSPGPAAYNATDLGVFKDKAPCYSMTSRNVKPLHHSWKPGPGTYSPEYVTISRKASPQYRFGIRHSLPRAPIIVDKPE